jgi:hypothetical protein
MNKHRLTCYSLLITTLFALLLGLAQPFLVTAATPERRFGAIDTFDNPAAATQLGAGWTRVRFPWADMQPNDSGQWNTSFFTDEQLNRELAAGREVVGLIVNTPPWALQDGNVPGVPSGLTLPDDDPNNLWAAFVRKIVSQYASPTSGSPVIPVARGAATRKISFNCYAWPITSSSKPLLMRQCT